MGNVSLGTDERLLANPLFGHLLLVGVAHLKVVAEDIVEADLETTDAGVLRLTGEEVVEVLLAGLEQASQLV